MNIIHDTFNAFKSHRIVSSSKRELIYLLATSRAEGTWVSHTKLFIFNTKTKEWSEQYIVFPVNIYNFGCVLTNDERYILMFAGDYGAYDESNKIYWIYKLYNQTKSYHCPFEGRS